MSRPCPTCNGSGSLPDLPTYDATVLSERLGALMAARDMSHTQLAGLLGLTQPAVSRWLRGVRHPKCRELLRLCDIFDVSADYLLGRDQHGT